MLECFLDDPTLRQAEHPHFHSEGLAGVRQRSSGLCFLKLWLFGELVDIRGIKCASPSNCHALIAGAWNLWELTAVGMAPHRMHNSINLGTRQRVPCLSFRQESLSQFAFQPKTRSNYWMACQMTGANSPCQPTLLTSAVGLGTLHKLAALVGFAVSPRTPLANCLLDVWWKWMTWMAPVAALVHLPKWFGNCCIETRCCSTWSL